MATVASMKKGLALSLLLLLIAQSLPASAQSQVQIGIEVVGNGNAGANAVDSCTSVSRGDSIDIDIYVRNVTDLIAWEAYLHFEEDKLAFVSADPKLFLQNESGSKLLTLSEALPRGRHFIGAADSSAATESGSGVLARVTLRATAAGLASIDLPTRDVDGDGQFEEGPRLTTTGGGHPGDTNGDGVFDGSLAPAFIAIDTSCSGAPTPAPDPGSDDDPQPGATTAADVGNNSGSDNGDGSEDDGDGSDGDSVPGVGDGDGDADDGPSSDDSDTDSDGGRDGGSGDSSDGDSGDVDGGSRNAEAPQGETSGGLSDALVIAIAVAGAVVVAGVVMFGLQRWQRPAN